MSGVIDVGDSYTITYHAPQNALVTLDWIDPDENTVFTQNVQPADGAPGNRTVTFTPTRAGMWTARFLTSGEVSNFHIRATAVVGQAPPLAAVGDVSIRYGALTPDEAELTRYLLKAASKMVRQRFPTVDQHVAAGRLDGDVVAQAVAGMVLRVLWNPEGLRSETNGPFSRTFDTSAAAGMLVVTTDDAQSLVPPDVDASKPKFFVPRTIRVQPGMAPPVPPSITGFGGYGSW